MMHVVKAGVRKIPGHGSTASVSLAGCAHVTLTGEGDLLAQAQLHPTSLPSELPKIASISAAMCPASFIRAALTGLAARCPTSPSSAAARRSAASTESNSRCVMRPRANLLASNHRLDSLSNCCCAQWKQHRAGTAMLGKDDRTLGAATDGDARRYDNCRRCGESTGADIGRGLSGAIARARALLGKGRGLSSGVRAALLCCRFCGVCNDSWCPSSSSKARSWSLPTRSLPSPSSSLPRSSRSLPKSIFPVANPLLCSFLDIKRNFFSAGCRAPTWRPPYRSRAASGSRTSPRFAPNGSLFATSTA
jgi:hypothetical protein